MRRATTAAFRVDDRSAFVVGGWSEELGVALRQARPAAMELQARNHDLAPFAGSVESVVSLKMSGSLEAGRIETITGLDAFGGLRFLEILAPVKKGLHSVQLPSLTGCALSWQTDCEVLAALPTVQSLTLRGYTGTTLAGLPTSRGLSKLWLDRPAIVCPAGLRAVSALVDLRLTNAKALLCLDGLEGMPIVSVDIETAPLLKDISALGRLSTLRKVRLIGTSAAIDLSVLSSIKTLRRLHAGGPGMPVLDWPALMALPELEFASGGWDAAMADEPRIRSCVSSAGRVVVRFSPVAKRGVQPLVVELTDV